MNSFYGKNTYKGRSYQRNDNKADNGIGQLVKNAAPVYINSISRSSILFPT
ncbi:hypothetical protein [Oribacterium sp. KHPX15]|uniref:hypothetical protein n=1 Tax=Oribacterium sp. KHPX15 TaxID=1855342 RepID=UPI0015879F21|nr:hypothetical protein [Oribacterium sp. KHPX15]